jgi:hypothetical protein
MIDIIYQLLKTIVNKELRGNVTPAEFNLIAKQAQDKIFRGYMEDANRDKIKENRGVTSKNYAHLSLYQRQRIDEFSTSATLDYNSSGVSPVFDLPADLYYVKDHGISVNGNVVDEVESADIVFLSSSLSAPSETFPVYERNPSSVTIVPSSIISGVICRYLKIPSDPKWTYFEVSGTPMFNNAAGDFQDFELHESEFTNIVIIMLSYFGINIREIEVTQYAEALRQKQDTKEEQ